MTEYEILLLLDAELSEDRQNEIVTRIRETIESSGGGWDRHDVWGRRKLAYEIDHKPEGLYHLLLFSTSAETLDEITRVLRITDGVLRHLAVRRLKGSSAPEAQAEPARAEEPQAEPAAEPTPGPEDETREPAAEPTREPEAEMAAPAAEAEAVQEAG